MSIELPDFMESGQGETVVLIHSSVAGAKQWRSLMESLSSDFHVVAVNLFGYGKTRAWVEDRSQTLEDQAKLMKAFLPSDGSKISIVGHSFGGSVAMKAALIFKDQVRRLVLVEPNPFYLLEKHGRTEAFQEAARLQDAIKTNGRAGTWETAAETFANYWRGSGSWDSMPQDRRSKFALALKPNFHEWDAVMNERTSLQDWEAGLPKDTTVVSSTDTVRSIHQIVQLMREHFSSWNFEQVGNGGHMAMITKPEKLNPIVANGLV
ncbi:Pimeloyl-ACP methyl ester carboxylesterase [Jannaschia faecimaris]|uniref:Pimeloyl-ACP methyl ester carboxylesterase n=1 Tax=Jannaschia faecimaris TaxID=1244108 RepID=A0A1H3QYC8_9RHOB|nr:alpha/beta fold hydrolase [Jannaschia faecimaris]SDZ18592.1 Pimeloyl-ACP methyl ester carboxylesterase [Jannaschia faecimaris]